MLAWNNNSEIDDKFIEFYFRPFTTLLITSASKRDVHYHDN